MSGVEQYVMDVASARRLTERIRLNVVSLRDGVERLQALLEEAKEGNVHVALGYASWTAYVAEVMGDEPLRLSRDDRREIVGYLTGEGMSTRAIGQALGVHKDTVRNDLHAGGEISPPASDQLIRPTEPTDEQPIEAEVVDDDEPDDPEVDQHIASLNARVTATRPVVGLDGRTYTQLPPRPRATSAPTTETRRRPITDDYRNAVIGLGKSIERIERHMRDDRFLQNAQKVADANLSDLLRAQDALHRFIEQIKQATGGEQ